MSKKVTFGEVMEFFAYSEFEEFQEVLVVVQMGGDRVKDLEVEAHRPYDDEYVMKALQDLVDNTVVLLGEDTGSLVMPSGYLVHNLGQDNNEEAYCEVKELGDEVQVNEYEGRGKNANMMKGW